MNHCVLLVFTIVAMTIIFNDKLYDLSKVIIPEFRYMSYMDKQPYGEFYNKPAKHKRVREGAVSDINFSHSLACSPLRNLGMHTNIRSICLHTNRGMTGPVILATEKVAPKTILGKAVALAKYQSTSKRVAGWDYTVDYDGTVAVSNDPFKFATYHAGTVNDFSVGIEMVQQTDKPNAIYEATIESTVLLVDVLTFFLGIQRQIICYDGFEGKPLNAKSPWFESVIPDRLQSPYDKTNKKGKPPTGQDVYGIYGHRNVTLNKGAGDPGNHIFDALEKAGYEVFNAKELEDLSTWKKRQKDKLGFNAAQCDGLPGIATRQAIIDKGISDTGLWVKRPIDEKLLGLLTRR